MTTKGIPRPMKFSCLQEFVFGSSAQFSHSNFNNIPKTGGQPYKKQSSLYDRYNVNNLQLNQVNKNHLQILTRNIVINQQDLQPIGEVNNIKRHHNNKMKQPKSQTNINGFIRTNKTGVTNYMSKQQDSPQKSNKIIPHTSQGFFIQEDKPSKQYTENQLLFNFKKIAEEKKTKKKEFLQTMQAKLNRIEQQTKQLQEFQNQQQRELKHIQKIHHEISKELTQNTFTGNLNKKITRAIIKSQQQNLYGQFYEQKGQNKLLSLHQDMSPVQINHALTTHYEENQKLLDQVYRIKSRSKEKQFTKSQFNLSPSKTNAFEKTSKIQSGSKKNQLIKQETNQKKLFSTTTKLPPKSKK